MKARAAHRLAWSLFGVCLLAASVFVLIEVPGGRSADASPWFSAQEALGAALFSLVGALIASRRRDNRIGWLFILVGASFAVSAIGGALSDTHPVGSSPWRWGTWINTWSWVPGWFSMVTLLLLLFPDGHLPSRGWRWAAWAAGLSITFTAVAGTFDATAGETVGYRSPLPTGPASVVNLLQLAGMAAAIAATVAAVVVLVRRFRRSSGEERLQMKWFVYAAIATVVLTPARSILATGRPALLVLGLVSIPILPVAVGVAILKYRLYDIDVVINKTVVYGALAAFITAVYVAIVVGIGALIGQGSSRPNLALSILATAVVAVAFQPVRSRVQRFANRLVYGQRATPYEVLSEFSHRMAGTYATEDVLPRMARILAEGTGAAAARVWLRAGPELHLAAAYPPQAEFPQPIQLVHETVPAPEDSLAVPVHHRGELLGALTVVKSPGDRLTPAEEKLAQDLASQAGLVLRNVRLTEELLQRLKDLQASRQRIVAAQDEERRRLERNIHDGAQQQLVALAVRLRLARSVMGTDPAKAAEMLQEVEGATTEALEDLRDLARGIYPPLLADKGLVSALESQARKAPLPVQVESAGLGRYPVDVEAAVYFCVLEALQNVAKYAEARSVIVRLEDERGRLTFTVADDGVGFDPATNGYGTGLQGMADRVSALGGELAIDAAPGRGTTVTGAIPVPVLEPVG